MLELLAHRLFVEHAEYGVFAMHRGHDADAEVDEAALVADAETAVLGHAALGDVELAHDLDAGEDGVWCSRAMGAMACCSTPSMRYLTSSESS